MNQNLIDVAKRLRNAGNETILAILALEKEGDTFKPTIVELKLQVGDCFAAVKKIEVALGLQLDA